MNNESSNDVTRMRQAPTILQYSHQSRSQSDDLASLWLCRRQLGNSPMTDDPNVASKCLKNGAGSDGRRNTCLESSCRSLETQGLSGTLIQAQRDLVELRLRDRGKVGCSGEGLSQ